MSALPLLWTLVLTPTLSALLASRAQSDQRARGVAIAGAALTLALALAALLAGASGVAFGEASPALPRLGVSLRLGLDGYSLVLPALTASLLLAMLIAGPRTALDRRTVTAMLFSASAILGVLCTEDLAVLTVAWVVALLPGDRLLARSDAAPLLRRTYRIFLFGGAAPLVAAVGILAALSAGRGAALPFDLRDIARVGVPEAWQPPLFALLGLAVLMRMAAVPFHSWLPALFERGSLGVTLLHAEMQVGLYVLLRVAIPLLPAASVDAMPILAAVGLLSIVYGAVLALVQTNLRRMIGYIASSQKGVVLLGVASASAHSLSGALLQAFASALAITGLTMVVWALEARTGTADTRALGGLVARMPRMTAFFFLLGCATIGFPGALTFISEDLLLHGVLHVHPVLAFFMLIGTAINGITLFRAFKRTFLGPLAPDRRFATATALLLRERAVLLALVALTVILGVAPTRLIALREPAVELLLQQIYHGASAPPHEAESRR